MVVLLLVLRLFGILPSFLPFVTIRILNVALRVDDGYQESMNAMLDSPDFFILFSTSWDPFVHSLIEL